MRHSIRRMPELPDVVVYIEALERRIRGARLERVRVLSPFVLRSVDPPLAAAAGRAVSGLRRLGKRIVIGLDGDLFLLLHLMIAGDRKSTRLNSSHGYISYAVFCLKKKNC